MTLVKLGREEKGQGLVEYSLIITLVATAVIIALISFGNSLNGPYQKAINAFK